MFPRVGYDFNTFHIYPRDAFYTQVQNFPIAYTISVSDDNSTWKVVYETDNGPIPANVQTPAIITLTENVNGRYVQITFRGVNKQENASKWEIQLTELEIYSISTDDDAVENVKALIDAVGTVTLDSEEAIAAAREAYDALTEEQKALVDNYDVLTAAEVTLAQLKQDAADKAAADKAVADAVADKIAAIGTVTLDSEEAIAAAREAYDALTEEQKALVDNYDVLTAAEATLAELKDAENKNPQTGDSMMLLVAVGLLFICAIGIAIVTTQRRKFC